MARPVNELSGCVCPAVDLWDVLGGFFLSLSLEFGFKKNNTTICARISHDVQLGDICQKSNSVRRMGVT